MAVRAGKEGDAMQEKNTGQLEKRSGKYSYRRKGPVVLACLALVLTLLGGLATMPRPAAEPPAEEACVICEAAYPERVQRPSATEIGDVQKYDEAYAAWREDRSEQMTQAQLCVEGLAPFLREASRAVLTGSGEENRVFSPVSLYMTLAMLTEVTGGETRQQLLDLLGAPDVETLREQVGTVWEACYCDDGVTTCLFANSVWLDEGISFVPSTMETLAGTYYASSYQGRMGSEELNEAFNDWLGEQTDGFLGKQASEETLSPNTVLALVSTAFYQAAWGDAFQEDATEEGVFETSGGEVPCDFMKQIRTRAFYWGNGFSAVSQSLDEGREQMWLILPDEGVTPQELLEDGEVLDFLLSEERYSESALVRLSLPKFDVTSELHMESALQRLGVVNVFSPELSNFAPLTDHGDLYVGSARQTARVSVDEEGCTGAAYTRVGIDSGGSFAGEEEIAFTLDRPFLYAVVTAERLPLLVGIMDRPA